LGKKPVVVPQKTTVQIKEQVLRVQGPMGELSRTLPPGISARLQDSQVFVGRADNTPSSKMMHGLWRKTDFEYGGGSQQRVFKSSSDRRGGIPCTGFWDKLIMQLGFSHARWNIPFQRESKLK